jgi:uncharacterized alpha-E superfamily protein
MERADHLARILDVHAGVFLDRPGAISADYWARFLALADIKASEGPGEDPATELSLDGMRDAVAGARRLALSIRPSISTEVFEQLNVLHWKLQEPREQLLHDQLHDHLVRVQLGVHLVVGLIEETMAHDEAWDFLRLGKYLERAGAVTQLVTRKLSELAGNDDPVLWAAVLKCCSSFEAYRNRFSAPVTAGGVAAFLLLDRSLPRSAGFCVNEALGSVRRIDATSESQSQPHRIVGRLSALFDYTEEAEVSADALGFQKSFFELSTALERALHDHYFQPNQVVLEAASAPVWAQTPQQQQQEGDRHDASS